MPLGASWPPAPPARHSFLRQPSSYLVIRAPGWKNKGQGPREQAAGETAPWTCTLGRFQALRSLFFLFFFLFASAKTGLRVTRAKPEGEARWVLIFMSLHLQNMLGTHQIRRREKSCTWVCLPVQWQDPAGHGWAQRRSFMISEGSASPTTFAAPRPDLFRVTSTITCTVLFSPGWQAAPSARIARGARRGELPGTWGSL